MKKLVLIFFILFSVLNAKQTISQGTYKKLQKAHKLIEKQEYTKARNILLPIIDSEANDISKSYAYQSLANISLEKNDYKKVASIYEKILKLQALEINDLQKIKFSLSQIYLSEGEYKKSIAYSKELLNSSILQRDRIVENLALAYYYDKKYKQSIPYIKQVIKKTKKKESWYRMLYSSHVELKQYKSAISTLKYLVRNYSSNENYWMQLISLYQTTKQYKKSLATLELVYDQKIVSQEKNVMYLVNILLQNRIYNKAGLLMEEAINKGLVENNSKNFNIMVSSLLNAKNYKKALPKLNNSKYAKSDKFQLILGNIYYNKSDYKNAIRVLEKHKFKTNTRFDGQRYTLLALSFYEINNTNSSKKYLKKASKNRFEKRRAQNLAKDLGYKI